MPCLSLSLKQEHCGTVPWLRVRASLTKVFMVVLIVVLIAVPILNVWEHPWNVLECPKNVLKHPT